MLKTRLITAALFASLVIYILSFSPDHLYSFFLMSLLFLVVFLSGTEFAALRWNVMDEIPNDAEQGKPALKTKHFFVGFSYSFLVFLFYFLFYIQTTISFSKCFSILLAWVFFCLFSAAFFIYRSAIDMNIAANKLLNILAGFIYLSLPGISLVQLASMHIDNAPRSAQLYFLLTTVFMGDTGAYFIGIRYGKHKLLPRVSPKKSIEGALGGLAASMTTAVVLNALFHLSFPWFFALFVGALLGLSGQIGDLIESAIKRAGGYKDSGNLLPGHGGVLDRIDSVILAVPIIYILFSLSQ